MTLNFLKTLMDTAGEYLNDVVYVDNGSPDNDAYEHVCDFALYRSRPIFKLIKFDEGVSLSRAWNAGVGVCSCDRILISNNDIVFNAPGWLEQFDGGLDNAGIGVVGPTGMSWMGTSFIQGSLFGFRREQFNAGSEIGFDERYLFTCEDVDWCHRLANDGLQILQLPHLITQGVITHLEGATRNYYKEQVKDYQRRAHISRIEYCYKWTYPWVSIND